MSDTPNNYRLDLQGLRAIAISLVIISHTGLEIIPGGFIGVDIFFVLSGYLITGLLLTELKTTGRIALFKFYLKRLKRLFPALAFMVIASSCLAIWLLSGLEAYSQLASSPYAMTWTSNLYFTFTKFDYFDELSTQDLYLHTWSLGVEEQFYLVWPLAVIILFWLNQKIKKNNSENYHLISLGFIIIFFSSLALSVYWTNKFPQAAFYLMPSRIWQLTLGGWLHLVISSESIKKIHIAESYIKRFPFLLLVGGIFLIIFSAFIVHPERPYPGLWALLPSLGAVFVIATGVATTKQSSALVTHPLMVWLGDRSYSLYLWHWPIFIIGFSLGLKGKIIPTLGMVLLTLFASTISYRLIEFPFWKGRWSRNKPRYDVLVSIIFMTVFLIVMSYGRKLPKTSNNFEAPTKWVNDAPIIYQQNCDSWYSSSKVEPCIYGDENSSKTVVFLGDSIGGQWFSMIHSIFPKPNWRTVVFTKSSCPVVDEDYYYERIGKIYNVCSDWRNAVLDELEILKPDVVFIGSSSTYEFSENQWIEGTSRILERINNENTTVFIIPGTPGLGFHGPACVFRNLSEDGQINIDSCLAKGRMEKIEPVVQYLEHAANRFNKTYILNLNDLVCPGGNCYAINQQGVIVFRDSQHLSDTFVRKVTPNIRQAIDRILPGLRN